MRQIVIERAAIATTVTTYLAVFHRTLPHSDALRIVRQIEASDLAWNPNHLIFDPFGYAAHALTTALGMPISTLGTFSVISGAATVLSLLLFHSILARTGVTLPSVRLAGTACLWASHAFLSQSISQYYFMLQMPFLMGALYLYYDFARRVNAGAVSHPHLYGMGVLLASAATLMFNNLLLVLAAGIGVGLAGRAGRTPRIGSSFRLWGAAAAVGVPVFVAGYLLSGQEAGFWTWLLSYGGDPSTSLNAFYGIKWTSSGVTDAAAMVTFNAFLGSVVTTAGLGTILRTLVSGSVYEFEPNFGVLVPNMLLAPAVLVLSLGAGWYLVRSLRRETAMSFLALWLGSYLAFNFLWNVSDDIFWIQLLPVTWLVVLRSQRLTPAMNDAGDRERPSCAQRTSRRYALVAFAATLLVVNTRSVVLPYAGAGFLTKQAQHEDLLRSGDLEIVPGWDEQKWMFLSDRAPTVQRFVLMNAALEREGSPNHIKNLGEVVERHLREGGRVIVARLYDLDDDLLPWYSLTKLGWPRRKIQGLLQAYCNRPLAEIDGARFRQLYVCGPPEGF